MTLTLPADTGAFCFYASATVTSSINFAVGEFGIASAASLTPALNYVALGDSYSSGEGSPPFIAGTDAGSDYHPAVFGFRP